LERAARFNVPQSGWGFLFAWKRMAYSDVMAAVGALVTRWNAKLAAYDARIAAYDALSAGTSDVDRFHALESAELVIPTARDPLPPGPAELRAALDAKRAAFVARRDEVAAVTTTNDPSFANLLAAVRSFLPISAFDAQPFDVAAFEDRAIVMAQ